MLLPIKFKKVNFNWFASGLPCSSRLQTMAVNPPGGLNSFVQLINLELDAIGFYL
jgi:hypothetical protein